MLKRSLFILICICLLALPLFSEEIHKVVQNGELEKLKAILEKNPEQIELKLRGQYSPLLLAAYSGQTEVAGFLLDKGADIKSTDRMKNSVIHMAAMSGSLDILKLLVAKGVDINYRNMLGETALLNAIDSSNPEMIDYLLDQKVDFEDDLKAGRLTVLIAARSGSEKLVNLLIGKGLNPLEKSTDGGNLLHSAATGGLTKYMDYMLKKDTDINSLNYYGWSALHLAVKNGRYDAVKYLIENGADLNIKNKAGYTAYKYAKILGNPEIIAVLEKHNADKSEYVFPVVDSQIIDSRKIGNSPNLFAPGIISTMEGYEFAGTFTPDGKEYYFTRRLPGKDQKIYYTKYEDGKWTEPVLAPFSYDCPFEFEPSISPDGSRIFFGSRRPKPGEDKLNSSPDIWMAKRENNGWSEPEYLMPGMYVTSSLKGTIFYTSFSPETGKSSILYRELTNGKYTDPVRLPDKISNLERAAHSFIAPDESYMIFDHDVGNFQSKLVIVFKNEDGTWSDPYDLGKDINQGNDIMCSSISPDGRYLFFSMNGDIYWVSSERISSIKKEIFNEN